MTSTRVDVEISSCVEADVTSLRVDEETSSGLGVGVMVTNVDVEISPGATGHEIPDLNVA